MITVLKIITKTDAPVVSEDMNMSITATDTEIAITHYRSKNTYLINVYKQLRDPYDGVILYLDNATAEYSCVTWGDKEDLVGFTQIVTALNIDGNIYIFAYCYDTETLTSNHDVSLINNMYEYLNTIESFNKKKKKSHLKYNAITSKLDPFSSIATLEAQVDYLTKIIQLLIAKDELLSSEYNEQLLKLLSVSNFENGSNTLDSIITDKEYIRNLQKTYFEKRTTL